MKNTAESQAKAKEQALKKIESIMKKSLKALIKDINNTLKEAKSWYCSDDYIKDHEELRKPSDRNGDQLVIDYTTHILNGGEFWLDDIKKLWTKEDINNKENN